MTCSFEYCIDTVENMSYVLFVTFTSFVVLMVFIIYYYFVIVRTVHIFYKKMRSKNKYVALAFTDMLSTEAKINQVAITSVLIWLLAWTPYTVVCLLGQFGPRHLVTPMVYQIPSLSANICTVFNSIVFGFSHPNIKKAMKKHFPWTFKNKNKEEGKLSDVTTLFIILK